MRLGTLFSTVALSLLIAPFAPFHAEAANVQSEKLRIGVVPFQNASRLRDGTVGGRLAEFLTAELMQNRNYELIERSRIESIASEQAFGMGGMVDSGSAAQAGKILGLDYIVFGSLQTASHADDSTTYRSTGRTIHSTKSSVTISVTVVEVETGRIVISDTGEATKTISWGTNRPAANADRYSETMKEAIGKAGFAIRSQIAPLEPSVIQASQREVTLDMGSDAGIRVGQKFEIVREGEALTDLQGNIIDVETTKIADITIKSVGPRTSVATVARLNRDPSTRANYVIQRGDLARSQEQSAARTAGERFNRWISQ